MSNRINIAHNKQKFIIYVVLILATFAVYWQVNCYEFINFDDHVYVTGNIHIQSGLTLDNFLWAFSTTYAEFWHPLTWLTLMLDNQIYDLNAGGYHLTNLILHTLSVLLLFWLFHRMTGMIWQSAFVAALFALHPLHVESVACIARRKDVLSTFFCMLTLCFYVYYTEKPVIKRYFAVLVCFICGLMSKPMLITLPIIMILLDYWPLKRLWSREIGINSLNTMPAHTNQEKQKNKSEKETLKKNNGRKVLGTKIAEILPLWQLQEKIPFFILSVIFSIVAFYAHYVTYTRYFSLNSRIANALASFVVYLERIFWPHDFAAFYPFVKQISIWQSSSAALLIIIISFSAIITLRRLPYFFVGWFWYTISILPVMGIIRFSSQAMSDHYTYLPSIGISIIFAWGIPSLFSSKKVRKRILFPATIVVLTILAFLTWKQCSYWENSINIWNHTLRVTKDNYLAHNNLGSLLLDKGKIKEAIEHFNMAIRMAPDYPKPYYNRGNAYAELGKFQLAIEDFSKAICLDPNFAEAYFNRGNLYLYQGNIKLGCLDAQKACISGKCELLEAAKAKGFCR